VNEYVNIKALDFTDEMVQPTIIIRGFVVDVVAIAPNGMMHPKFFEIFKCEFESENNERKNNWGMLFNL
jgi:hypothetical protein